MPKPPLRKLPPTSELRTEPGCNAHGSTTRLVYRDSGKLIAEFPGRASLDDCVSSWNKWKSPTRCTKAKSA